MEMILRNVPLRPVTVTKNRLNVGGISKIIRLHITDVLNAYFFLSQAIKCKYLFLFWEVLMWFPLSVPLKSALRRLKNELCRVSLPQFLLSNRWSAFKGQISSQNRNDELT